MVLSDLALRADRGYLPQLGRWCERLPAAAVAGRPSLLLASGQHLELQGRYGEAAAVLWRAELGFATAGDGAGASQARQWRARLFLRQGRYAEAADLCQTGLSALPSLNGVVGAADCLCERADLLAVLGACGVETGDLAQAERCYGEARWLYERLGDRRAVARLLHNLGTGVYLIQGRLAEALEFDQASLRILEQLDSYLVQFPLVGLAWEYQSLGQYAASRAALDRLLRQADAHDDHPLRGYGLYLLGHLHRLQGQRAQARISYSEARSLGDEIGEPTLQVEPLRGLALLALDEGNPREAYHLAGLALERAQASGYRYWQGLNLAVLGRAAAQLGQAAQAEEHLFAALVLLRSMGARFEEAAAGLYLAEVYAASGREAAALAALEDSLALAQERSYLAFYTTLERARAIPLLVLALSHGSRAAADVLRHLGRDAVPALLATLAGWPTQAAAGGERGALPWAGPEVVLPAIDLLAAIGDERAVPLLHELSAVKPLAAAVAAALRVLASRPRPVLRIHALGGFRVSLGDEPLPAEAWQRRKSRLLLLYLLRHAPRPASRDELIDLLWPDLPFRAAGRALNTTFSDLRKLLEPYLANGQPSLYLLREGESYAFNIAGNYEYDVHTFERSLAGQTARREALALYSGDFLPEEPYVDWVLRERERLRSLQLNAMIGYLDDLVVAGTWREGCDVAQQVLEREPCLEEVWRVLIQCHLRLGRRGAARLAYQACVTALREQVDAEPDAATRALLPLLRE